MMVLLSFFASLITSSDYCLYSSTTTVVDGDYDTVCDTACGIPEGTMPKQNIVTSIPDLQAGEKLYINININDDPGIQSLRPINQEGIIVVCSGVSVKLDMEANHNSVINGGTIIVGDATSGVTSIALTENDNELTLTNSVKSSSILLKT